MNIGGWFKNTFLAHNRNSYRPKVVTIQGLLVVTLFVFMIQLLGRFPLAKPEVRSSSTKIQAEALVRITNQTRQSQGVGGLQTHPQLAKAAQAKADDMVTRHYWDHDTPDGQPPWIFLDQQGYTYQAAGENLAKNFDTNEGVVTAWLNSPEHKQNMLNSIYTQIGVGIAQGEVDGENSEVIVAMYAAPAAASVNNRGRVGEFVASSHIRAYSLTSPLFTTATLSTPAKVTSLLLLLLAIVYIGQHISIKRRKLHWDKGWHRHPLLLAAILLLSAALIVASSFGAIR